MSKIRILSLNDYLPRYKVLEDERVEFMKGKETELGTLNTDLEDKITKAKEKEKLESITQDEEMDWLGKNILLGEYGEKIAFNYLSRLYSKVSLVSSKAYLGYDIEINEDSVIGVEVKTTKYNKSFHITYNELNKATIMKERYFLFFIKVDEIEDVVFGYLIQDPIKCLNIDFNHITNKYVVDQKLTLIPNKFYIQLHQEFIESLKRIPLDNFV